MQVKGRKENLKNAEDYYGGFINSSCDLE